MARLQKRTRMKTAAAVIVGCMYPHRRNRVLPMPQMWAEFSAPSSSGFTEIRLPLLWMSPMTAHTPWNTLMKTGSFPEAGGGGIAMDADGTDIVHSPKRNCWPRLIPRKWNMKKMEVCGFITTIKALRSRTNSMRIKYAM